MKSFQLRVTWWIALALFTLMFFTLVAFNIYAIHEVLHQAKKNMRTLSRTVLTRVTDAKERGEPLGPRIFGSIDEGLEVLDPRGPIAYALFTDTGKLIHRTSDYLLPADRDALEGPVDTMVLRSVESPGGPGNLLSEWHLLYRTRRNGYLVLVSDREDYESVERFANGFLVILLLAAVLSIPCGYALSRRILVPLAAIHGTIQEVRGGNLKARVPVPRARDEIAQLARDLNRTFADLETLLDGMRRFCADAAHELKTPLTALRGNLEVCLAKDRTPEEYRMVLGESVAEIASLSTMVHDLLLLSVSGDRCRTASHRNVCPGPLFREIVGNLTILAEEHKVRLENEIDDALQIMGDEALLPRICYNLLDNALRYAPEGSSIMVRWERQGDNAVLTVTDQGPGIDPKDREKIFERFYQVDESRNRGTGLGLAIVKWIAELHDGSATVESSTGKGASFRVCFPARDD
jgi:signal transduction histidine kinase